MRISNASQYRRFRQVIVRARTDAGVTQAQLAKVLRRPQSFVSKYESGERRLDVIEFVEVALALRTSPQRLIDCLLEDRTPTPRRGEKRGGR